MKEYVNIKNSCLTEKIKDILGEFMSFHKSKMEFKII